MKTVSDRIFPRSRLDRSSGQFAGVLGRPSVDLVCFPLVAGVYLVHFMVSGYSRFYYDAEVYWQLGRTFEHNGHFSLVSYDNGLRGYSVPLLSRALITVGSWVHAGDVTIVKIFGALLAAALGVSVLPRLARCLFSDASVTIARVLALNAVIFLYWRDHFDFPLSDFPAVFTACVGVLALFRGSVAGDLVAGLAFGLAANMRPAYVVTLLAAILVAAVSRARGRAARGKAVALLVVGALVASFPQMLINHHQRGGWSPLIPNGREIALLQLTAGMQAQKYETYIGPSSRYPTPQVFYLDPATQHVLAEEQVSGITSYRQYLGIVVRHPAEMSASYVRRIFNGLDVRYPTVYVRNLNDSWLVLSLLNYTLIFLAVAVLIYPETRRALGRIRWSGVAVLASASLTAVPGAVEPRFFVPIQVIIYMLVCFSPMTTLLVRGTVQRRIALLGAYVAFLLVCLTLSSATLSQLEHPGPTLGSGASRTLLES